MPPQDDIIKLITENQRRLQKLKEQKARSGINVSPEVSIEIEDIEAKIEKLQVELKALKDAESASQTAPTPSNKIHGVSPKNGGYRPPIRSKDAYNFENRNESLRWIFSRLAHEPYLHLYGPGGIGKTYLTGQLLKEQNYYAPHPGAYLDFTDPRFKPQSLSVNELLQEIQRQFCQAASSQTLNLTALISELAAKAKETSRYGVVVLDNIDRMAPGVRRQLRKETLPALQDKINDPALYLRFIAIAQPQLEELSGIDRISFHPYRLEEFRSVLAELKAYKGLLRQAVERWGEAGTLAPYNTKADNLLKDWADALYDLTGGHPGAIEGALNYVGRRTQFAGVSVFEEQRQAVCRQVLAPLVEQQVQSHFRGPEYQLAFQQLWVFRYLSKGVFKHLLRQIKDKPQWRNLNNATHEADYAPEHAPLWGRLTETPLLHSDSSHQPTHQLTHQLTPIWRKLGNLTLQATDPRLHQTLHTDVRELFEHLALDEPAREASLRIDCFVEMLYHLAQETRGMPPSDQSRRDFTGIIQQRLENFLPTLQVEDPFDDCSDDYFLRNLRDLLKQDQELRAELNQMGQPDTWQRLLDLTTDYLRRL